MKLARQLLHSHFGDNNLLSIHLSGREILSHLKKSRNILLMIVHKFRLILISRLYIGCFLLNFAEIWHPPPVTYWTSGRASPIFAGIIRKPKSTPKKGHFRFWLPCDKIFLEFHHMIRNLKWFSTIYTRELQEGKDWNSLYWLRKLVLSFLG